MGMAEIEGRNALAEPGLDDIDLVRSGPGTLMGRYLRTFWQPAYRAEDLPAGEARPARIMGQDFTLYRGESGRAQAVGFRCAHRAAQMSRLRRGRLPALLLSRLDVRCRRQMRRA